MTWYYQGEIIEELPADCEGFVYLITNLTNDRKYVGKKLAKFKKVKPPLKGKKNKRRSLAESDWKEYWGSSDRLQADIEKLGKDKFSRQIIHLCKSRGATNYMECYYQMKEHVLLRDNNYNGIINIRLGIGSVKDVLLEEVE